MPHVLGLAKFIAYAKIKNTLYMFINLKAEEETATMAMLERELRRHTERRRVFREFFVRKILIMRPT